MAGDLPPDDLGDENTIQIPQFTGGKRIFGRYMLQKVLGRGGMGVVWLARDEHLDSLVALKVLPDTLLLDSAALDSLKNETKMGRSLAHRNIVRIFDFQQDENLAAISMEYVDGGTLSDLRIQKPNKIFEAGELLEFLDALCDGLDYAHTRERIVHRDLKPRNLMVNSRGELKIADFGISKSISESMTLLTGKLGSAGSPPYISPQQWDGERPTALDDIYSVGATLYELLTGKPPLLGVVDSHRIHTAIPPPVSQRRIDLGIEAAEPVPEHWEQAIAACLAKDPKQRPQTIRDLQSRLLTGRALKMPLEAIPAPSAGPGASLATGNAASEQAAEDDFGATMVRPSRTLRVSDIPAAVPEEDYDQTVVRGPPPESPEETSDDTYREMILRTPRTGSQSPPGFALVLPPSGAGAVIPPAIPAGGGEALPVWVWVACAAAVLLIGSVAFIKYHFREANPPKIVLQPRPSPTAAEVATPSVRSATPAPPSTPPPSDPIETAEREMEQYDTAQTSSKYVSAALELVRRLTTGGEPSSKKHETALEHIIEGLRSRAPLLGAGQFNAYKDNFVDAARLDITPAVLVLADNLKTANSPEAFGWYYYAAEVKHNSYAMRSLAWLYWLGTSGAHPDKQTGFDWFKRAFEAGDTMAGIIVGNCYLRGEGTMKDENAGISVLLPLANSGVANAKTLIGECYYYGYGQFADLSQDQRYQKAKDYFEEAIAAQDWSACGHLGVLYETGQGVPKDWKQAVKLYLQGVDHKNPVCMYYYARAIENHQAEIKKIFGRDDKAETYYRMAARAGVEDAIAWCSEHHIKY